MIGLWIAVGCVIVATFLWGICAGKKSENDDADQMAAIEAWQAKQVAKDARRNSR